MENNHTISEERNEMLEIPTTVIYRKNISQCSKSFLIDTLLSKNDSPADEVQSPEGKRLKINPDELNKINKRNELSKSEN